MDWPAWITASAALLSLISAMVGGFVALVRRLDRIEEKVDQALSGQASLRQEVEAMDARLRHEVEAIDGRLRQVEADLAILKSRGGGGGHAR